VEHIYVSQWYLFGATIWFPFLYLAAAILVQLPVATGVMKATANWWFAHNVLGLWLTPIGLASAYYLIPKVLGRPIHSYYLSILGFWTLAIFYNWAGTHHLVGGPLPAWLVTVGIVGSMMMFVPVATVAINHHFTVVGRFGVLATSPTLRFTVFGAMSYTLVSVQGSLTSLRMVNEVTHFTHYTIAHAHLGVYAFYTMVIFGAMYYILPRLVDQEWISSRLIRVHFWCSAVGLIIYWAGLTFGGVWQGVMMNDPDVPFLDIVGKMIPFLWSRSLAGVLMTVGHVAFGISVWHMLRRNGAWLVGPTLFTTGRTIRSSLQRTDESPLQTNSAESEQSVEGAS
jgi:cytochrome c oxidase cbb3-type subunit 1